MGVLGVVVVVMIGVMFLLVVNHQTLNLKLNLNTRALPCTLLRSLLYYLLPSLLGPPGIVKELLILAIKLMILTLTTRKTKTTMTTRMIKTKIINLRVTSRKLLRGR